MKKFLKIPLEYGKFLSQSMKAGNYKHFVKADSPSLREPSSDVELPLTQESQDTIQLMMNTLQHKDCPLVLDSISAPMLGH